MLTPAAVPRGRPRGARRVLEDAVGQPVLGYRAPSYSIVEPSLWALDVLIEEGYAYDASIFPIHHDRYGIPNRAAAHPYASKRAQRARWSSCPASTVRLGRVNLPIAGGGYFRLLPYHVDAVGHRPRESRRAAAGGVLSASVGNRSRAAADAGWSGPAPCATIVVSIKHADGSSGC